MNVLAVFVLFLIFFMCTPDNHPSSLARFKSSKTVNVKKFPLFKIWTKPLYFVMDILWQFLELSGPPATQKVSPFQNIPLSFFISATPWHWSFNFTCSIHFLKTCATAIPPLWKILKFHVVEVDKIVPMPRPFTSFTKHTKIQLM